MQTNSDLPVEKIQSMLDEGMRQTDVASAFNVSQATISRLAGMPPAPVKKTKKTVRLCSCCEVRPIAKGNRFLCSQCYRLQDVEEFMVRA